MADTPNFFGMDLTDPRAMLAQQLMQGRSDEQPLERAVNPIVAALMLRNFSDDQMQAGDTMSKAMQAAKGWVSPDTFQGNNGQTIKAGTVAPGTGGTDAMLSVLQSNPTTRPMATQFQMQQLQQRQALAAELAKKEGEYKLQSEYEPRIKGAIAGSEAGAKQPYEFASQTHQGQISRANTSASNRETADLSLRNDWQKPQHLGPGDQIINLSGGPSGAPGVIATSPNPPPGSQPGELEQYYGKLFIEGQNGAIEGRKQLNSSRAIQSLLDGVQTGKFAGSTLQLKKAALSAGINLEDLGITNDVAPKEAATALANAYALQLRNPAGGAGMPGAMSDADRQFLQSMTPGIETTEEGRQKMLHVQEKLQARNEQVASMQRQYLKGHNGRLDPGWLDELQQFSEANPLFKDEAAAPPPPPAPVATQPSAADVEAEMRRRGLLK